MPHSDRIAAGSWGSEQPPAPPQAAEHERGCVAGLGGQHQRGQSEHVDGRRRAQHAGLAEPVHQPPLSDGAERVRRAERADHPPGMANEPVVSRASSRIASPNIPIGIAPIAEATTGARASGRRSSAA